MYSLYRKYRPSSFDEVFGQRYIVGALTNSIKNDSVSHAYIFTGPRGVGKTTLARIFARAVNCLDNQNGEACGACAVCLLDTTSYNLIELNAADATGVDDVRSIIETVAYAPVLGKYKVYLIDEVHMFSQSASNALLKTLEEPPAHTIFILATTDAHKLLPTIISRSLRFDFSYLSDDEMMACMNKCLEGEGVSLDEDIKKLVVASAGGSMRDALSNLQKLLSFKDISLEDASLLLGLVSSRVLDDVWKCISSGDSVVTSNLAKQLISRPYSFKLFIAQFLAFLRQMILSEDTPAKSMSQLFLICRIWLRAAKEADDSGDAETVFVIALLESAEKFSKDTKVVDVQKNIAGSGMDVKKAPVAVSSEEPVVQETILQKEVSVSSEKVDVVKENTPHLGQVNAIIDSIDTVMARWGDVCDGVRSFNAPLSTQLRNRTPKTLQGNTIVLPVKYFFHKEMIESKKNFEQICVVLARVFGAPLTLKIEIEEKSLVAPATTADALQIFGGQLITT